LFEACKDWLISKGLNAMDGPVNFGERDRWWGLMVDGFYPPTYGMNYHMPYYRELFEEYGFRTFFEQYNYVMPVSAKLPEAYMEKYDRVRKNPLYSARYISMKHLKKYAEDFCTVYNKAWGKHDGFRGMSNEQALSLMKTLKPVMEEDLVWFVYYGDEPVGFFLMLPELNQIFRHLNGQFNTWAKLKFLYYRLTGECTRMFGVVFGIVPEHQSKGVEGYMIVEAAKVVQPKNKYKEIEMTWIGDFNPKMIRVVESLGATRFRTYLTMRKIFDPDVPFARAPLID
jgi:hypothetical protein